VHLPEIEGDELSKWLPAPEEQPVDELEYTLEAVDLAAEVEEPPPSPEEDAGVALFRNIRPEPPDPIHVGDHSIAWSSVPSLEAPRDSTTGAAKRMTTAGVDIIVETQPASEFAVVPELAPASTEVKPSPASMMEVSAPAEAASVEEVGSTTDPEPRRDPDEMREVEAGLAKFNRVVQVNPKNARAWDTLGNLYKSAGRYEEAVQAYQEAIRQDPAKALFHHHIGLVYACEGRIDEAIDAFQSVIRMDPDHALAHAALGGYYRKKGLEELAQKHIGIAMKSIFDSENEYNRACLAAICGNTEQALELLRIALGSKQTYVDWILRDPDLDFIRQDPRFKQLISDFAH
jgi:hypothetical protein